MTPSTWNLTVCFKNCPHSPATSLWFRNCILKQDFTRTWMYCTGGFWASSIWGCSKLNMRFWFDNYLFFTSLLQAQHRRAEKVRKRIKKAAKNCKKCVLLEWEEIWCDRRPGGLCNSIDQQRGLSYFFDLTHVSLYWILWVSILSTTF
jgi:hypothetical protein